jgi:hypothetical protein
MSAARKGMCDAQAEELELLLDLFRENPEDFWRSNKDCATDRNEEKLALVRSRACRSTTSRLG